MKRNVLTLTVAIFTLAAALCSTSAASDDKQDAKEQKRLAAEQAKQEKEAAKEAKKLAAEQAKRDKEAAKEFAEEQVRLQKEFSKYSTQELKITHRTYVEFLYGDTGQGDEQTITLSNPLATKIWGTSKESTAKKLIRLEREMLRRWKAGDKEAYLPSFDAAKQ